MQRAPVVRWRQGELTIDELRWGLVPRWAKDETLAANCINARCETVADKPMFRDAFQYRRCLVPADGYFEWQKTDQGKLPWRFVRRDRQPLLLAGLWDSWRPPDAPDGQMVETYAVLTTTPNGDSAHVHSRMPVILEPEAAARWLDPGMDKENLQALCASSPDGLLEAYRVSTVVNSSRNDSPECVLREPPGGERG
jgi:putative SOS response-associated peptidase YedK